MLEHKTIQINIKLAKISISTKKQERIIFNCPFYKLWDKNIEVKIET